MSVGGQLEILKKGSLVPTRVTQYLLSPHTLAHVFQNAYHTELGINLAKIMPVDILHDCDIGFGSNVFKHNVRIFYALGGGAVNLFDAR